MPIINLDGSVQVEYVIPEDIDSKIPEAFYPAMAGELCAIFGPRVFEKISVVEYDEENDEVYMDEDCAYYDLSSSTGGWVEAFKATCEKLDMMWLLEYWNTLEWYDSDIFDGIIEDRIIDKFIESEDSHCNAYYRFLVEKGR